MTDLCVVFRFALKIRYQQVADTWSKTGNKILDLQEPLSQDCVTFTLSPQLLCNSLLEGHTLVPNSNWFPCVSHLNTYKPILAFIVRETQYSILWIRLLRPFNIKEKGCLRWLSILVSDTNWYDM